MSAEDQLHQKISELQSWESIPGEEREAKIKALIEEIRGLVGKLGIKYFEYNGITYPANPPLERVPKLEEL